MQIGAQKLSGAMGAMGNLSQLSRELQAALAQLKQGSEMLTGNNVELNAGAAAVNTGASLFERRNPAVIRGSRTVTAVFPSLPRAAVHCAQVQRNCRQEQMH